MQERLCDFVKYKLYVIGLDCFMLNDKSSLVQFQLEDEYA